MNGGRGVVVGILQSPWPEPPQIPDYVVVDTPWYTGDPLVCGNGIEKSTPVPISEAFGETMGESLPGRFPLIPRWAIIIAKSQGLTIGMSLSIFARRKGTSPSGPLR